jgi:hypothetical protein
MRNNIAKNVGLIVIVFILMFLLRPSFFLGLFKGKAEAPVAADSTQISNNVEYAEGYDSSYFNSPAYQDPSEVERPAPVGKLWPMLMKVVFMARLDEKTQNVVYDARFTPEVKKLNGQEITIDGYVLPLEYDGSMVMFSAYPMASCFFCGGSGPESIIEVYPKKKLDTELDKLVKIKGKLELNASDQLKMPYIMRDAELVRE